MRVSIFPVIGTLITSALLTVSTPALAVAEIEVDEEGGEIVTYADPAATIVVEADESLSGGVHIDQIGEQNTISLTQSKTDQLARFNQSGNQSRITLDQQGDANHFANITQNGDFNELDLSQSGSARQIASLEQTGNGNMLLANQSGSIDANGIFATQLGNDNLMSLTQTGSQNHASLTQNGSGNTMTASQIGDNNSLIWTQTGDNLSDLAINQTGNQTAQVTQSR